MKRFSLVHSFLVDRNAETVIGLVFSISTTGLQTAVPLAPEERRSYYEIQLLTKEKE